MLNSVPLTYEEWLQENEASLREEWMRYRNAMIEVEITGRRAKTGPSWYDPDEE